MVKWMNKWKRLYELKEMKNGWMNKWKMVKWMNKRKWLNE